MRRTRRHRLVKFLSALGLVAGVGTLAWWLGRGPDSAAIANQSDAQAAAPAISQPASAKAVETPAAAAAMIVDKPVTPSMPAADPLPDAVALAAGPAPAEPTITISRGRTAPATGPATAPTTQRSVKPTTTPSTTRASSGPIDTPALFGMARTKVAAGDLVGAREVLNSALAAGGMGGPESLEAKRMIAEMSRTLVFSSRRMAGDPWIISHLVEPSEVLAKLGSMNGVTASFLQQINGITDARKLRSGYTIKIVKGPFHAVVTKHAFTMDLYLGAPGGPGSMYVTTYRVGLGSDDSTPTGKWLVEPGKKLPNPTYYPPPGQGPVIEADDPRNPLGRYWIGLKGIDGQSLGRNSYGIHGTIEPDTIGKQASLGCIRLLNQDVAQVFMLLVEGKSTVMVLP